MYRENRGFFCMMLSWDVTIVLIYEWGKSPLL